MDRKLTQDERDLANHITRWGSDGYPIVKYGRKWTFRYRDSIEGGKLWDTRREAVAMFEAFMEFVYDAIRAEKVSASQAGN